MLRSYVDHYLMLTQNKPVISIYKLETLSKFSTATVSLHLDAAQYSTARTTTRRNPPLELSGWKKRVGEPSHMRETAMTRAAPLSKPSRVVSSSNNNEAADK